MEAFKRFINIINPFNMGEVVSTVLQESNSIQEQLKALELSVEAMKRVFDEYDEKIEKAETRVKHITTETIHILETIKISLESSCDVCKQQHVKTIISYCDEIIKEVKRDD